MCKYAEGCKQKQYLNMSNNLHKANKSYKIKARQKSNRVKVDITCGRHISEIEDRTNTLDLGLLG